MNKRYQRLEQVQEEPGPEQGSKSAEFTVNDFSGLDYNGISRL